jgi:hypothetical protein
MFDTDLLIGALALFITVMFLMGVFYSTALRK